MSGIGLLIGLYFLLAGNAAIEPLVGISSMAFYASTLLFAFIALPAVYRTKAGINCLSRRRQLKKSPAR